MASVAVRSLVCFLFLSAMLAPYVEAQLRCLVVVSPVGRCMGYLNGRGGGVPSACCDCFRALNSPSCSKANRQSACRFLKQAAAGSLGFNFTRAGGLSSACGINIGYIISPCTNCATVK